MQVLKVIKLVHTEARVLFLPKHVLKLSSNVFAFVFA